MMSLPLLTRESISKVFWEPYILTGYRRSGVSFLDCVKYTLVVHNDWGNFWTHFIPFWAWLYWLYHISFTVDLTDPFWYPLLTLWAGGCTYAFCSSMAHAFACKSLHCRQICFMIDYHGISLYGFGGGIAYYFYERPTDIGLFEHQSMFVLLYIIVSLNATFISSLSRFYLEKYRYLLRAAAYVLPYIFGCFPFFARLTICLLSGKDCIVETLPHHFFAFVVSQVLAFFFVTKLPERKFPGKFDYFFQSHQLFHVLAVILTSFQFYMIPRDAMLRYSYLSQDKLVMPTFNNTILSFVFVMVSGFIIVGAFSYLVMKDVLVSNKKHD